MLPFKGHSNFRNTWPPAQASSCGNLSTLQPTGTKRIPCRSVAATMLHVAAMLDSEWKKMVRFDDLKSQNIPKSSKSGEIILDRSLPLSPISDPPILQVFVAANSNAVLRLVHVDLLDSESHIARPRWVLPLVLG